MGTKRPKTITRADIARHLASAEGLAFNTAKRQTDLILDFIRDKLGSITRVELRGFGSFRFRIRQETTKHNPRKPEDLYVVPAHNRVVFIPVPRLKKAIIAQPLVG